MKKTAFLRTAFLALAFCMAFVLIPNSNASVSASEMPSGHTCDGVTYDIPLDSSFTGGTLASGNYYLTEGITLAKKIEINAGSDVKICLNGKSINTEDVTGFDYTIRNYGTLTLNNCDTANGIINTYSFTFLCYNNSVLYGNAAIYSPMEVKGRSKISGCTFNNDISCTANSEITGGTFLNRTYIHNSVVISGGTFNQEVKVFDSGVITGGYFSKAISSYNGNFIKGGYFKTKPDDSYIADGYVITDSGDTNYPYRVVMPHTCNGVTYDKPLDSSFTGGTLASGNYYLTEDITLASIIQINAGSDVKICLNGKSISGHYVENYGALTLNNCNAANGKLNNYYFGYGNSELYGNAVISSTNISLIEGNSRISGCVFDNYIRLLDNTLITGGTFNQRVETFDSSVIAGGYFSKAISAYNEKFIRGGYFKTKPDDSYIDDGYVITDSGDTNYPYRVVMPHTCNGVTYDKPLDSSFTGGTLASGNYYLTEDIDLTDTIKIAAGSDVKICLNGKNISGYNVENRGTLTLNNCNAANGKLNNYYHGYNDSVLYGNAVINTTVFSSTEGTSKISGCIFDHKFVCAENSEITGGTFNQMVAVHDHGVITGGYFGGTVANGTVGKFIKGGYFKTKPDDNLIADGYAITASGNSNYPYKVVATHSCNGVTYDKPLDSSFKGGTLASGNYYLTEDIDLTDTIKIAAGSDVKICLNGKSISEYYVNNYGTLTLNNCNAANGKVNTYYNGYNNSVLYGNAVINNTIFSSTEGTSKISGCIFDHKFVCMENSEITGGTFNQTVAVHDYGVITGGYFGGTVASGTVDDKFIKGGYFKTKPNDNFIADGYAITASGNSNYPYKVVATHTCDGVTYNNLLDSTFTGGTLASGNYYLTENLTLTSEIRIDRNSIVKICLNGHSITQTANTGIFANNGSLDIIDCMAAGTLSGGKGCTSTQAGGCIYNSGTITISGITMDGNSAPHGGAVSNYGDMQITNCTITNNSANGDGGGINNTGTLTVTNTEITGNNAVNGGGISTIGKLTLNNVTVTGNTADYGSGIRTNASPDVTVSGDIIIRDNSAGKYPDMLLNSSKLAVDANGPGANSYISVSAIPAPTSTAPVSLTGTNNADYSGYFHTDNPDYAIINGENNTVMLVMGEYTVTFDANGHGTAPTQQKTTYGGKITEPAAPTAENYYFQGWFKESTCENMWDFDSDIVTANITLYAKWSDCDHSGNTNTLSCTNNTTCSVCGGTVAPTGHTPSASWSNDSTDHWKICENPWCGEIIEKSAHTYGGWTVTIPATEEHEGERQHTCTECGYTETEIISKEAHVHSFGSEWKHDGTYHWHECDCGERTDVSAHTPDGGRTAQSGGIYTGTLTYTCTVCGSVTGTERIKDNKTYDIPDYTFAPLYIETGITYEKLRIGVETDESSVTLSWNSIGGAKGYKVYVYDSDDALISVKKTDETTITFKKLTNGETYRFVVKYTLSGRSYLSNYSDEAKVTIIYKPFVKVSAGFGSVKLSWEAVEGAEKYAVYKINDGRAVKLTETTKLSVRISTSEEGIYGVKAYVNGKWTTLTTSDLVKAKAE